MEKNRCQCWKTCPTKQSSRHTEELKKLEQLSQQKENYQLISKKAIKIHAKVPEIATTSLLGLNSHFKQHLGIFLKELQSNDTNILLPTPKIISTMREYLHKSSNVEKETKKIKKGISERIMSCVGR